MGMRGEVQHIVMAAIQDVSGQHSSSHEPVLLSTLHFELSLSADESRGSSDCDC